MKIKEKIKDLILENKFDDIFNLVERPSKLIRSLTGLLYIDDMKIRHGAAYTLGLITQKIYKKKRDKEKVQQLLQKLLWSLNDESGFVCWGAPEAIGEIVKDIPDFKMVYAQFLISFLSHPQVILNNDDLEKSSLIGLARIGELDSHLIEQLAPIIISYIENREGQIVELAVWSAISNCLTDAKEIALKHFKNSDQITVYINGEEVLKKISDL